MTVNPISEEATGWFFYTRRLQPKEWELDALSAIDAAFMGSIHEEQQQKVKKPKK